MSELITHAEPLRLAFGGCLIVALGAALTYVWRLRVDAARPAP
jgi:hypothetical protein